MIEIIDRPDASELVFELEGHKAHIEYRIHNGKLIIVHTEVPEALGGRGLAGALVGAALDKAEAEGLTIWPWCPYARSWLQKHPEEAGRVAIDWAQPPE